MLTIILTVIITAGLTATATNQVLKLKPKSNKIDGEWHLRPVLEGEAWKEFRRSIAEDCKGWKLAHALIYAVFSNGFRFTCLQIYDIAEVYTNRFPGNNDKIKDIMKYELTLVGEAQEKIEKLICETDECFIQATHKEQLLLRGK